MYNTDFKWLHWFFWILISKAIEENYIEHSWDIDRRSKRPQRLKNFNI